MTVEDLRAYYSKILPVYEKESAANAHLAFWRGLARSWRPGRILEIGSGLGRITGALSRHAPTVGIDISVEMLARARRRRAAGTRARFVAADMRDPVFGCRFDLIVAPSDPFSHWTAIRERRRALRQVADQLSSEGRFVLEGLYRRGRRIEIPERRVRHSGGVLSIGETWTRTGRDLWEARYRYRDRAADGTERTIRAGFVARAWNPAEIRSFFNSCGLTIETLWGDYDQRPFRANAERLIIVARRRARFVHRRALVARGKRV